MIDFLLYITAGAGVGLMIGITGVGGGSLMTPLLLLFGFPAHTAVGTDLLYAGLTKASGIAAHQHKKTIVWPITLSLAAGSIPAAIITILALEQFFDSPIHYQNLLQSTLGFMLILTSAVLLSKRHIQQWATQPLTLSPKHKQLLTFVMGIVLGIFVTLSSVGAGAFGAAVLLLLYPRLSSLRIIGTDIAHAVPLTLVAGLGHCYLGNVDFFLLAGLLFGSLPAINLGVLLASRIPEKVLHPLLSSTLMALGVKYAFF